MPCAIPFADFPYTPVRKVAAGTICPDEIPRRSHRGDFAGYLNLASLYALEQEKQKAREVLLDLLKRQPQHKWLCKNWKC